MNASKNLESIVNEEEKSRGLASKMASRSFLLSTSAYAVAASGPLGAAAWTGAYLLAYLTEKILSKKKNEITKEGIRDQITKTRHSSLSPT